MTLTPATRAHLDAVEMLRAGDSKDDVIAELTYAYQDELEHCAITNIVTHAATVHQTSSSSLDVETSLMLRVSSAMPTKDLLALVFELKDTAAKHGVVLEAK